MSSAAEQATCGTAAEQATCGTAAERATCGSAGTAAGFTLLEVLVAVTILGVGLVSLLGLHVGNLARLDEDRRITEATLLAQGLMTEIESGPPPALGVETGDFEETYPERYPHLGWEREILRSPLPDLREVRVRVYHGDGEIPAPDDVSLVYYARLGQ